MIDPEIAAFLTDWKTYWADVPADADVTVRRRVLEHISSTTRPPLAAGFETEVMVAAHAGREVRVRIFRKAGGGAAPALVFMHGGSWMIGSPETHFQLAATLAEKAGHTVISVDYALAPEHPFPSAVHDCDAVIRWAFANAATLGLREDAISVGGESAGANLAAAMTLRFRGTPQRIRSQLLFYPPVDFTHSRPSFVQNADAPMLTTAALLQAMAVYVPNRSDRLDPMAAPMQAGDLRGLPPAFIAVAENDPLRDDGIAYAKRLHEAGVPVELHAGAGLVHGYLRALPWAAASREALDAACAWLRGRC